jgi:hypothetical protein
MIHGHISFERAGLDDDDATRAQNVNGLAGKNCASWLKQSLANVPGAGIPGEPVAEDWGWALVIDIGADAFVLGCSADEDSANSWHVLIGDNVNRGFWPATRRRRTAALEDLTKHVDAFLRAQGDVANVTVETK